VLGCQFRLILAARLLTA